MSVISLFTFTVRMISINSRINFSNVENGHWLIGGKYQNVGGFRSSRADLDEVPREGWLYNDGTQWNGNDTTITVKGNEMNRN